MPQLPARPSAEFLRKEAKRYARTHELRLSDAQRQLAAGYGYRSWTLLMRSVAQAGTAAQPASLFGAVRSGDADEVRRLLTAGANPQLDDGRESALHVAARRGPLAVVEALIEAGAMDSRRDAAGRTPLDVARRGRSPDRAAIVRLLDRRADADPSFRAAIDAIAQGDTAGLRRMLDAEPRLLRERILGPDVYRRSARPGYFRDPKLFWYIANNPRLVERMPSNIGEIARVMLERGIDRSDLDIALHLVMTSAAAREQGVQRELVRILREAGAALTRETLIATAAHRQLDILRDGWAGDAALAVLISAALGDEPALAAALATATVDDRQLAFALAAINGHVDCVRSALAAGADVNAYLPPGAHAHGTALHQAAANDDAPLIRELLAHGARTDVRDTLWNGTPLDWAIHEDKPAARAALELAARNSNRE